MSGRGLWAGVMLALAATALPACSGDSSQGPTPTAAPSPMSSPPAGPPQVEAGSSVGDPAAGGRPEERPREAEVIYFGPNDRPGVAVTFDTGTMPGYVPKILDILKKRGKPATFGVTGEWAGANPELLKRIVKEGHAVINHSWSHTSFTGEDTGTKPLTADEMRAELGRTEKAVRQIAGVSTKPYFRPPYGDYDLTVNRVAGEEGYRYNVLWLVDGMGWAGRSAESVTAVTLANAHKGAIFLYHTDNPQEYQALEKIIEGLDERGLVMVTVPQLLSKKPIPTPTATPTATVTATPTPTPAPSGPRTPSAPPATPTPTRTPIPWVTLALDDFESGGANGGRGWLGPWQSWGPFGISAEAPHAGTRALDVPASLIVSRELNLAGRGGVHLRFWSRLSRLDHSRRAAVLISAGPELSWQVVKEFSAAEADGAYRRFDVDLSRFELSERVRVGFYNLMDPEQDRWFVDDVELATLAR